MKINSTQTRMQAAVRNVLPMKLAGSAAHI